jgi:hypothetical protein
MGEPVSVIEKPSGRHGVVRFDTNRSFTGMGHERYERGLPIPGDRPPDVLARALFETGQVEHVHIYAQTITVTLGAGSTSEGLRDVIEGLYIYYKPGVEVPTEESFNV